MVVILDNFSFEEKVLSENVIIIILVKTIISFQTMTPNWTKFVFVLCFTTYGKQRKLTPESIQTF